MFNPTKAALLDAIKTQIIEENLRHDAVMAALRGAQITAEKHPGPRLTHEEARQGLDGNAPHAIHAYRAVGLAVRVAHQADFDAFKKNEQAEYDKRKAKV